MEKVIETIRNYVEKECEGRDSSHGFAHMDAVSKSAKSIFHKEKESGLFDYVLGSDEQGNDYDLFVAEAAGLLHDVADHKYFPDQQAVKEKKEEMKEFLTSLLCEFDIKIVDAIMVSIEVSFSKRTYDVNTEYEPLRRIVCDADRMEALGEIGIKRCYTLSCKYSDRPLPSEDLDIEDLNDIDVVKLVVIHCHEKLYLLPEQMYTQTGKTEAGKQVQIIKDWIKRRIAENEESRVIDLGPQVVLKE